MQHNEVQRRGRGGGAPRTDKTATIRPRRTIWRTPEQVPSDLTLELGGNVSPDRFLGATRAFFGCVEEISRAVAPEGEAPTWIVRTREGSHLIGVDPAPGAKAQLVRAVYDRMKHGVEQLAAGEIDSARLPDAAIRHLKNLSEYAERPRKQSVMVRIWVEKKAVALGSDVTQAIVESWGADYKDYGTIEGRLEAIQDREALKIRVRDAVLRQTSIATFRRTNCRTLSPTSASASRFQG